MINKDKLNLTKDVLEAMRATLEKIGEDAADKYPNLGGQDAIEAFVDAVDLLRLAVAEGKEFAHRMVESDLVELLKTFKSQPKKNPYNQT